MIKRIFSGMKIVLETSATASFKRRCPMELEVKMCLSVLSHPLLYNSFVKQNGMVLFDQCVMNKWSIHFNAKNHCCLLLLLKLTAGSLILNKICFQSLMLLTPWWTLNKLVTQRGRRWQSLERTCNIYRCKSS